jgi:hypothetical protein
MITKFEINTKEETKCNGRKEYEKNRNSRGT